MTHRLAVLAPLVAAALLSGRPATADTWSAAKCTRYREAWTALRSRDAGRLGQDFVDANAAFVASGCTASHAVCPRSPAELAAADTLTVVMMNFGTASTFLPFGCPPSSTSAPATGLPPI